MHDELAQKIIQRHFGTSDFILERKTTGLCNEVYEAKLPDQNVIIRIGVTSNNLLGSSKWIPIFETQGISVPKILFEDYSKTLIPYPYQVMSKLPGQDLGQVIEKLSETELSALAQEIASIVKRLAVLPTNGRFGWFSLDDSKLAPDFAAEMRTMLQTPNDRMQKTGIYDEELAETIEQLYANCKEYFKTVPSLFYYDDLNSKNVMIENGRLSGLVDLDGVSYGDPLQAIGAIRASWPGTTYGDYYIEAVMDALNLTAEERHIVSTYAIFHRYSWMSENGIAFNANTEPVVNRERLERDKNIIRSLLQ